MPEKVERRGGKREGAGRKPGYVSELRKIGGHQTKVARIPKHWTVQEIQEGLELLQSIVADMDEFIEEKKAGNKGKLSDRWFAFRDYAAELRAAFPKSYFEHKRWKQQTEEQLETAHKLIEKRLKRRKAK